MNLPEIAVRKPVIVALVAALVCLLGVASLLKMPVQLFPDIEAPVISVQTSWRAAAPAEVEAEILEPQERALQGLSGLEEMNAFANAGNAFLNLRFAVGTDMQRALIEVISRMNQLPPLPRDATPPTISLGDDGGGGPNETLSWFFVQLLPGTPGPIEAHGKRIEELVRPRIESVPGVAAVRVNAGADDELQVVFDPYRAADLGVELPQLARLVGSAADVSGGFVDIGRRQYTLRFAGRYGPDELANLVLDTLGAVKVEIEALRNGPLAEMGLTIAQSFDPSVFINQAIGMVSGNLVAGIVLAALVLWLFIRERRATLIVALAIPICLLATLLVLYLTGRTLNVISIAGLAFAAGMTMDAAVVVLESIIQHRERGEPLEQASIRGTQAVWPALFASTATLVIVFLPIVFIEDAEGQLFADLALAIAIAVSVSLLAAVTLLPAAAARWLKDDSRLSSAHPWWDGLAERVLRISDTPARRHATIALLLAVPAVITWLLLPPLDYLPPVKRDAIDGFFQFPPGASVDTIDREIVQPIAERMAPYMAGEQEPKLKNYYVLVWPGGGGTIGARPLDPSRMRELETVIREEITVGFPDTQVFLSQGNLFGGFGDGRNIDLQFQSADLESLLPVARRAMELVGEKLPGAQVQAFQGLEAAEPELRVTPDDRRIGEIGWTRAEVGTVVRALGDGAWVGEYFDGERRLDMILRSSGWDYPEALGAVPVATPAGSVPLGELVRVETTVGPAGLRRVDGRRTLSLNVSPPPGMSLQQAIEALEREVEPELRKLLPADGAIRYAGNAGSLRTALASVGQNIAFAVLVLFLLMALLFRSARDSLLVLLTVPLASCGGVLALQLARLITPQTLDLLTMVGFIILMGVVVNNAILLADQARAGERAGLPTRAAIHEALRLRVRPIFATTLTAIVGMLPLVLVPGPGSALYRGLGIVMVGGMTLNTAFLLLLLPALLRLHERPASAVATNEPIGESPCEPLPARP
jgi:multidrug efflux pump subunit AcrB